MHKIISYNCFFTKGEVLQKECKNKNKIKEVFVLKNLTKLKGDIQMN